MKISLIILLVMLNTASAAADRLSVGVSIANIRSGAGDNYRILWKIEKYHPIERIKTSGGWYYVQDYEGDKGWIYKLAVSQSPSVIIIKDKSLVRSNPNSNAKILFSVGKGVSFKVLERKTEWIHIEHADGNKGWINQTSVW